MSDRYAGTPDPPGQPRDTGEWRSQQGVELGFVKILSDIMEVLADFYAPEYEQAGRRIQRTWIRGGIPGHPEADLQGPAVAPNWFIGEQYLATQGAPHRIVFARTSGIKVRLQPPIKTGDDKTGYRQIANAVWTVPAHIWAFDDDDLQALVNMLLAAAYYYGLSSNQGPPASEFDVLPKVDADHGVVAILPLQLGIPMWLPPLKPKKTTAVRLQGDVRDP